MDENKKQISYVGWVPCLNGKLVFDLVECGLKVDDNPVIEIVHYDKKGNDLVEYVLIHSTVNWKDFGGDDLDGVWSVLLLSERSNQGDSHVGTICFIPKKDEDSIGLEIIKIASEINLNLNSEETGNVVDLFTNLKKEMDSAGQTQKYCYLANFNLDDDGLAWVQPETSQDEGIIARQAYYYIKYAWHKHRHHDSRAETLTTVHEIPQRFDSQVHPYSKNRYIATQLIDDLKKNLVRFKRGIDDTSHGEVLKAKGIVSYTKSLVEILKTKRFIDRSLYRKEINHLRYFQESLDIISTGIEKNISLHNQAFSDAKAFILFVFAMIMPVVIINKDKDNQPEFVAWIFSLFSSNTSYFSFLALMIVFLWVYVGFQIRFGNFWIFQSILKKSVAYIVKDRAPNQLLSNTNVMTTMILLFSSISLIYGIFLYFNGLN